MNTNILAKKYAQAFLDTYAHLVTDEVIQAVKAAALFLAKRNDSLFFLRLSVINEDTKKSMLLEVARLFDLQKSLAPLLELLARHNRAFLLKDVLEQMCILYNERMNIMEFNVDGVYALNENELLQIRQFLAAKTGKKIVLYPGIEPSLIAGISIKSSTLMWEFSVRKQLDQLKALLRGEAWK
jgi:ATP synthase F1 delta subunit